MDAVWLLLSAPMGAGKDTVAKQVLPAAGFDRFLVRGFADPLRDDVDRWLTLAGDGDGFALVCADAETSGVPTAQVEPLARKVQACLGGRRAVTSRDRSPQMRSLLQWYGTEVRRQADADYWVRRSLHVVAADLAAGTSVVTTDCRFVNEVVISRREAGAVAVRLNVSAQVQRERLLARDGVLPAPEAFTHRSETELADYGGFDAWVDTSTLTVAESVAAVAAAAKEALYARR